MSIRAGSARAHRPGVARRPAGPSFDDGFTGFNAGASGSWNHFTAAWVRCVR
ncbi:uncharacterized protein SOCEGT47_044940 [Sorangium cellulosum]|uniref:Uncharacterized protein n=1 Tax=Sorangium cellulosum TaxID=56 RepID=A0A4P2Q4U9_SORCE|nr:uncharacterized protein SOCEGT47_044940 [Sorangium cellulosum]